MADVKRKLRKTKISFSIYKFRNERNELEADRYLDAFKHKQFVNWIFISMIEKKEREEELRR